MCLRLCSARILSASILQILSSKFTCTRQTMFFNFGATSFSGSTSTWISKQVLSFPDAESIFWIQNVSEFKFLPHPSICTLIAHKKLINSLVHHLNILSTFHNFVLHKIIYKLNIKFKNLITMNISTIENSIWKNVRWLLVCQFTNSV